MLWSWARAGWEGKGVKTETPKGVRLIFLVKGSGITAGLDFVFPVYYRRGHGLVFVPYMFDTDGLYSQLQYFDRNAVMKAMIIIL